MSKPKILTFEIVPEGDTIEIHVDQNGLKDLVFYLQRILDSNLIKQKHDHLMTESWGTGELTDDKQGYDNQLINMVTIYYWPSTASALSTARTAPG